MGEGPAGLTGQKSDLVMLALGDARVVGSGPTGPSVTLTLPLIFATSAANTVFTIEVSARDDSGNEEPFADAATITMGAAAAGPQPQNPSNDGDRVRPDRPRKLTEEQTQQHQHTNKAGLDDYRTEGNVTEVHTDAEPPYIVIGTRDGLVVLRLHGEASTVKVNIGDYVTAEGEKVTEQLYEIEILSTR